MLQTYEQRSNNNVTYYIIAIINMESNDLFNKFY